MEKEPLGTVAVNRLEEFYLHIILHSFGDEIKP
jgi:hypothetical protein